MQKQDCQSIKSYMPQNIVEIKRYSFEKKLCDVIL